MSASNFSLPLRNAKLSGAEAMLNNILAIDEKKSRQCGIFPNRHLDIAITQVAAQCQKDRQNATLGPCHYLTKFAHGSAVLVGVSAIPVIVAGAALVHLKNNLDHLLISSGVIASAWCMNKAISTVFGVSPLNYLALWAVATTNSLANKASDYAVTPYTRKEENVETFKHDRQVAKIEAQKEAYYGIAHHLAQKYQDAQSNPQEMYDLKLFASRLESKIPVILEAFESIDISPSESSQILDDMITVLGLIKNFKLEVRAATAPEDNKFNARLMSVLPINGFVENCIPTYIVNLINNARDHQLGIMHTVQGYVDTVGRSLFTFLAIPTVTTLATKYFAPALFGQIEQVYLQGDVEATMSGIAAASGAVLGTAAVAAGTLYASSIVLKDTARSYRDERIEYDDIAKTSIESVNTNLQEIYDGIGQYLSEQWAAAESGYELDKLRKEARGISNKLSFVVTELAKYPEIKDPKAILHRLTEALNHILPAPKEIIPSVSKIDFVTLAAMSAA